jgi:hypothetical protein
MPAQSYLKNLGGLGLGGADITGSAFGGGGLGGLGGFGQFNLAGLRL